MRNNSHICWIIENLTATSWFLDFFPRLIRSIQARSEPIKMYYLDGTKLGIFLAYLFLKVMGIRIEKLSFRMLDVKDQKNDSIWLNVMFKDALSFQEKIQENCDFQKAVNDYGKGNSLLLFLLKETMCAHLADKEVLLKYLFLVRVISWKFPRKQENHEHLVLFLCGRPWANEFRQYAFREKVEVQFLSVRNVDIKERLLRNRKLKSSVKQALYCWMVVCYRLRKIMKLKKMSLPGDRVVRSRSFLPKLAVEYYGRFNLDKPELFSDLFFYQNSRLSASEILLCFNHSSNPVTDERLAEFNKHGIGTIAFNSRAVKTPRVSVFKHFRQREKIDWPLKNSDKTILTNRKWLQRKITDYCEQCNRWVDFFTQYHIKTYVTWHKQGSGHCAITDALQSLGGISVIYQRSFEDYAEPWSTVNADVVFGFSRLGAHKGQERQSRIPYYIVTGYLDDYRFGLLRKRPKGIRQLLKNHGAKKILAYFDENESKDRRWAIGHDISQKNYAFLLNKVLNNPWFGLILKPKSPGTLRKKLGPHVCLLLDRAKLTGRCYVYGNSEHFSPYPPATAAINADIAVHGYLTAATAAVESALLGIPTLMMDYEGWSMGTLYKLGKGKVIFNNWDDLWGACQDYWSVSKGMPGIGDWSPMLNTLDPFRDGRAAERMGTFLEWIQEGFKANLSKEEILASAIERYTKLWGKDKVLSVNCEQQNKVMV